MDKVFVSTTTLIYVSWTNQYPEKTVMYFELNVVLGGEIFDRFLNLQNVLRHNYIYFCFLN